MTLGGAGDDVTQRKKILAEKLSKEQANLSFLKESLTKSEQLTQNMLGILSSFDSRLSKLEGNILPVHRETVDLQRRQKNIDKVLRGLDNVISYHNVASSEDQDIRDGPGTDVDSYLRSLEKVQDAIEFFEINNPNSPELSLLTSLMETGREQMERSFRNLLTRSSSPVSATTLLDILSAGEDLQEGDAEPQLKQINDEVIEDLSKIATWLVNETKSNDFMNVYAQIRSSMLSRTLQGLIEAHSQGKIESYSPANIMISPKIKSSTGSTPQRKSTLKRSVVRRVPSKTFEYGGSRKIGAPASTFDSPGLKEDEDEIEAGRFVTLCGALLKLLQSEQSLINVIIPQSHRADIFDVLIQSSMEVLAFDGECMANSARRLIAKREYFSLLPLLPVLKYLGSVLIKFSSVLQDVRQATQATVTNLFMNLEVVGAKALEDFTENIKHDPDKQSNMPKDGTVHELTSNTLIFLEHLLGYTDTVGNMLNSKEQVIDPTTNDVESPKRTVAKYIFRVLAALGLNLELKSKSYVHIVGQVALSGIFLLNNYNYILKGLQRTGVLLLMTEGGFTKIETQYITLIKEQKITYQKGWSKVMNCLLEMDKPYTQSKDAKVGQKQKQLIKDKFKGFNSEFEEICQTQKTYAVPDENLRDELRQENIDLIVNNYRSFQEKYTAIQFTKNVEKYVKYTPEDVKKQLSTLFDLSA
ncbi:exocyst complex component 7-like [Dendronephthya gigantea]|uniref:exocyst complex component 7-like n=1 Tax=Dendronephthya gigantea TaxID=151771 RepID=UPI00106BCDB2|nr:exocyst complex component 7-like [Dendronephthya gigantea]